MKVCSHCFALLTRKKGESRRDFSTRHLCNRTCRDNWRRGKNFNGPDLQMVAEDEEAAAWLADRGFRTRGGTPRTI